MNKTTFALIRTTAMALVVAGFVCRYHVVLPSDDLTEIQTLRKEHLGISDTIVVVPSWVQRYNAAGPAERRKLDESYLIRRLLETGMMVRG